MIDIADVDKLVQDIEDRSMDAVIDWKEKNKGPVVGCFPVYSPVEIFHAGGILPIGIFGAGTSLEITHADSRFQSFVCSIAKTTLEMGLAGKIGFIDGLFFSSICDVARNLSSVFKRNFPDMYIEYMHLPQNKPSDATMDYYTSELERIKNNVERFFSVKITDEKLGESIRTFNRVRSAVREIYSYRARFPQNVKARELGAVVRASTQLPPDEALEVLAKYRAEIEKRDERVKDRIKVIIEGAFCEQPPLDFIGTLEDAGCYIVDDDFVSGWRFFEEDVPATGDPLRALADSLLFRSRHSSVRYNPAALRTERIIEKFRALEADAVIIAPAKFCEPALFDYVLFRNVFEKENIPHLFVEFEEKMWTFERVRNEVETFVESLLFD